MINKQTEESKYYQFWLHNLPGVGDRTIARLLQFFGSEKAVYEADEKKLEQVIPKEEIRKEIRCFSAAWDLKEAYENLKAQGIGFLTDQDEEYPYRLRRLKFPPYGLYYLGNLPGEDQMAAAIIGARECSEYGRYMAEAFSGRLARAGVAVISGMARGIDGIAQQAAISGGGATFAVLGSGVDVCYPASNRALYKEILQTGGGILSVFPPGAKPQKRYFPERNRIVAGLSDILLVVEARQKSGTWITVDMALEQGKNVYAVPGRLTDRLSDGCNLLIRQGAGIALSPDDLLQEMCVLRNRLGDSGKGDFGSGTDKRLSGKKPEGERPEEGLLAYLDYMPRRADEILELMIKNGEQTGISEVLADLTRLCIEGKARQEGGYYCAYDALRRAGVSVWK